MQKRVLLDERFVELLAKAGSEPDETLHMGIRARVRTVNVQQGFVVVMDDEDQKTERFGDNCILDCKKAEQDGFIIYVRDGTEEKPRKISIGDLQEDDEIFVTLWESEAKKIGKGIPKVEQLQLGTQRLD
ncbi:MAG: hypothetical protein IKC24_07460 [Oscillospiraceae bacterium]|nr:hypothetical protein [Oscillospiraceae bacterium]